MHDQNTRLIGAAATFVWKETGGITYLNLYDKTKQECLRIAREFGYVDPCWYRPKTWGNHFTYSYKNSLQNN